MTNHLLQTTIRLLLLSLTLIGLAATNASAQTGSLRGQVTDQNDAIVTGAKVTARSGGQIRTATTDNTGLYSFANLPSGDYTIEASAPSLVLSEPVKITLQAGAQTLEPSALSFHPGAKHHGPGKQPDRGEH